MLEQLELEVSGREERGKNAARRLRAAGRVPATLYGLGREPAALSADTKTMVQLLSDRQQRNRVLALTGAASGEALAIEWQVDPVDGHLLHVDFQRIDLAKPVTATVAMVTKGVSYGVKTEGGIEDVILRRLTVRCLPADIPERIEVDITEMHAGDAIRIRDLAAGVKFELLGDPTAVVVRIIGKRSSEGKEAEEKQ